MCVLRMNKIERGHEMYRDGKYVDALDMYTSALSFSRSNPQKIALHSNRAACFLKLHLFSKDEQDREGKYVEALEMYTSALALAKTNPQKIALHSNRAACFLKLHLFHKAAEECTSVLELDSNHTGALMLRAQTLVTLKEYHSALFDVNRLTELNPSSEVYQNLHTRLKTQLSLAPIPEAEAGQEEEEEEDEDQKEEEKETAPCATLTPSQHEIINGTSDQTTGGWKTIPKPKGHSQLDYSRWDTVEDDSSEGDDSDDDEDSRPQFRFRVKTVGVRPVK